MLGLYDVQISEFGLARAAPPLRGGRRIHGVPRILPVPDYIISS